MSIDIDHIQKMRARIVDTAQCMLNGDCSFIEGIREIWGLLDDAGLDWREEPFLSFVALGGATDNVPIGEVRERWHPEAQIKHAQEWADAERYAKTYGQPVCRDVIEWLAKHPFEVR
jgi:hypothetical protein